MKTQKRETLVKKSEEKEAISIEAQLLDCVNTYLKNVYVCNVPMTELYSLRKSLRDNKKLNFFKKRETSNYGHTSIQYVPVCEMKMMFIERTSVK